MEYNNPTDTEWISKTYNENMDKKLNGFNNGRDTTDGIGGKPAYHEMEQRKIIGYKLIKEYPGSRILGSIMSINCATWYLDSFILKYPEFWEPVYEKEKLEISSWCDNYDIPNTFYNYSNIIFKGKLTKEIIDKIKEVL